MERMRVGYFLAPLANLLPPYIVRQSLPNTPQHFVIVATPSYSTQAQECAKPNVKALVVESLSITDFSLISLKTTPIPSM